MEVFNSLAPVIQNHIKQIIPTSGLPANEESYELLASAWTLKLKCFSDEISENKFVELDYFAKDEERGALVLTYSGSLINIGPLQDGKRRVEYTSIGLRTDVPDSAVHEAAILSADIEIDSVVVFSPGPIQQSSPVYKIAISTENLVAEEEEILLTKVNQDLTEDFVEVNKTIIP